MQASAEQLPGLLKRGLRSVYVLHGDEPLLVQEAQDAIRTAARAAGFTERSVHTVMGAHFDWGAVLAASGSMSLFADKQVVELRIPSGKPGKEGSAVLQALADQMAGSDSTLLLVTLPRLDFASKKAAWFAALESSGVSVPLEPMDRAALPVWIVQRMARAGLRVADGEEGQRSLHFFADRVEGNLLAAHQEIEKLALLHVTRAAAQPVVISFEQIEASVLNVARYGVPQLQQAVLGGQMERTQRMLDGLKAEGEAEVLVHWMLADDIRALKRVRDAMAQGQPLPVALNEQRVWGPKQRLFERALPHLSQPALRRLLKAAQVVDGICKGLRQPDWPHDPWEALKRLAHQLCRECAGGRGERKITA
ncbi:MAG: putative polymerase delta subunit [Pseudomonadota bacterium]|jgi:DNA polymerase III subunit delta